jgi:hypothetical protein
MSYHEEEEREAGFDPSLDDIDMPPDGELPSGFEEGLDDDEDIDQYR